MDNDTVEVSTSSIGRDDTESNHVGRVYSKGLIGLFEKIPITFKLIQLIGCLSAAFIGIGIILLIVFSQRIQEARSRSRFVQISSDIGSLIRRLQLERLSASEYINGGYVNDTDYRISILRTNETLAQVMDLIPSERSINLDNLYQARERAFLKQQLVQVSFRYGLVINNLLDLLSYFTSTIRESNLLHSYSEFNRIIENEYSIWSAGVSAGRAMLTPADRYRGLVKPSGVRDDNLNNWRSFSPTILVKRYDELLPMTLQLHLNRMFEAILLKTDAVLIPSGNLTEFAIRVNPVNFTLDGWNGNYTQKLLSLDTLNSEIRSEILSDARKELRVSIVWIVLILIGIAITVVFLSLNSSMIVYTIVHPWQRLNLLQDIIISKFVPRHILTMLHVRSIADIVTGKSENYHIVMIAIQMMNESDNLISDLNTTLELIGPHIINAQGFIFSQPDDVLIVCIPKVKKAMTFLSQIRTYNCRIAVHRTLVSIGAVGYTDYMEFKIIGEQVHICRDLMKIAQCTQSRMIFTDSMMRHMKFQMRGIGYIHDIHAVYESCSSGIDLLSLNMRDIASSHIKDDPVLNLYKKRYQFILDKHQVDVNRLRLSDILTHAEYKDSFLQFLAEKSVYDIYDLYRDLQDGINIYDKYIAIDSPCYVLVKNEISSSLMKTGNITDLLSLVRSYLERYAELYKREIRPPSNIKINLTDLM